MLRAYTISGVKAIKSIPSMDRVQFTLNHRTHPSKRQTIKALQELVKCTKADIYVHYDFIYIASRYAMFSEDTRRAILKEIVSIQLFAEKNPQVKGIVMHTDFGLKRDIYRNPTMESIMDAYNTRTWDLDNIKEMVQDIDNYTEHNLAAFYCDLSSCWQSRKPVIKVYLENTTKISPNAQGSIQYLKGIIKENKWSDLFGLCYDTEHDYAVNGSKYENLSALFEEFRHDEIDFIVHLNTVPEGVAPESLKDRHSDTTIFECSQHPVQYYFSITELMDSKNVPYIREVHEDTMYRELKQLEDYGISQ